MRWFTLSRMPRYRQYYIVHAKTGILIGHAVLRLAFYEAHLLPCKTRTRTLFADDWICDDLIKKFNIAVGTPICFTETITKPQKNPTMSNKLRPRNPRPPIRKKQVTVTAFPNGIHLGQFFLPLDVYEKLLAHNGDCATGKPTYACNFLTDVQCRRLGGRLTVTVCLK